jgi:RNA polymerase sigma-70 factor, ECF subfamily
VSASGEITALLAAVRNGDAGAENRLLSLVYAELNRLARRQMRHERLGHTLQPTALVNEAYIRLMKDKPGANGPNFDGRTHFFASASVVMRRILVDYARQRRAAKRPAANLRVDLDERLSGAGPDLDRLLVIDEALSRLSEWNPRQARLVEIVYFGGLTAEEAAQELGISVRTAKRDWQAARAWLHAELARKPK